MKKFDQVLSLGLARRLGRRAASAALGLALTLGTGAAMAATFPATDADWRAIQQNGAGFGDVATDGNNNGREIIGSSAFPAVFFATDATHFFVRLRVNDDPRKQANDLAQFGWGVLVDTDGDTSSYELSILVDGIAEEIVYAENTTKTGGARDLAETLITTEALVYGAGGNVRVSQAPGSNFGGNPDFFLDFAIPLAKLAPKLTPSMPITIWAGTSSSARRIDLDLAGVDGNPGNAFTLGKSDVTSLTGTAPDSDGDGVDDATEIALGTNPNAQDSDGDGILDNVELSMMGNAGPFTKVDTDQDGTIDALDLDSDNDCATDQAEGTATYRSAAANPNANCGGGTPTCDIATGKCTAGCATDGDCAGAGRICNNICTDGCRGGAQAKACAAGFLCTSTTAAAGQCKADTDGDGVSNEQEQTLGTDPTKKDTDGDGIDDNVELSANGTAGPFTAVDTDGDGVIDAKDLDSDNDCALDTNEKATWRNKNLPNASSNANCAASETCNVGNGQCVAGSDAGAGDAGTTDAGTTTDAGSGTKDAGTVAVDSGTSGGSDAGGTGTGGDAGGAVDNVDGSLEGGGLGCNTAGGGAGGGTALLVMAAGVLARAFGRRKKR